jgi:hypothetical protein
MFLIGLVLASAVILRIERAEFVPVAEVRPVSPLLQPESEDAGRQWAFVQRNTHPASGLTALDEGGTTTSLAGIGYTIKAVLAAHRLGYINGEAVHSRVTTLIAAGARVLPEQAGQMLAVADGAVSPVRALEPHTPYESALELVAWGYPSLRAAALAELERWSGVPVRAPLGDIQPSTLGRAARVLQLAAVRAQGDRR